jgi:hypothetical protein
MADQAVADALTALAGAIATMNANNLANNAARLPHVAITDFFDNVSPFDLSTRAGSTAFQQACTALDEPWDGPVDAFPAFIIAVKMRSTEVRFDAPAPQGIFSITTSSAGDPGHPVIRNILTEYNSITEAQIESARANRTDPRAIQNARAFYKMLKGSISGDIKATIFEQVDNIPTHEDGNLLWKKITTFTVVASLQLSMMSLNSIITYEPAKDDFKISDINKNLNYLFVLARTPTRPLDEPEKILHTLTVYSKIRQPEQWAQWTRNQVDKFEEGSILVCQSFMNQAVVKYNKITYELKGFSGSSHTIQEDIVAMVTSAVNKRKQPKDSSSTTASKSTPKSDTDDTTPRRQKLPPFAKHFAVSSAADAKKYKVGDSKEWNQHTWYFCDCPNHRDKVKWHTHPASTCRTRAKWLEQQGTSPEGNLVTDDDQTMPDADDDKSCANTSALTAATDVTGLLASALSLAGDNAVAAECIADALNALNDL